VNEAAARWVRAGHPWIFRESVLREVDGAEAGSIVRVVDGDGRGLAWAVTEPQGAIAARIVSTDEDCEWSPAEIARRVSVAISLRERLLGPSAGSACRLIHGEGDRLPGIAADRFGSFVLLYKYSRAAEGFMSMVQEALREQLEPVGIYLQDRTRPVTPDEARPGATLLEGKAAPPDITVEEDGLKFLVDVTAPVSPGLFLDLREGRRWLESLAKGRRVLNLFSFTGAFALRAVRGGAASVVNVDAAARSHARCRQNLEASGLHPESCQALVGDVFKHLERLRQHNERFDLVVVDPPPFSKVKGKVFSALRDWEELVAAIVHVAAPDAEILAVSNAAKLPEEELLSAIGSGAYRAGRALQLLGEAGLPPDFPIPPAFAEGRYLEIKRIRVM